MPIDSALEKLPEGEKPKEKSNDELLKDEAFLIFRDYLSTLDRFVNRSACMFNLDNVYGFSKFMRFDLRLNIVFPLIPKDEIIKVVTHGDPALERTLRETDLGSFLADDLVIYNNGRPKNAELFGLDDRYKLHEASRLNFLINNIRFLSLFMKNGALIRDYAKMIKDDAYESPLAPTSENPIGGLDDLASKKSSSDSLLELRVNANKWRNINLFNLENLSSFHSYSGKTDLKSMVEEYSEMRSDITRIINEYSGRITGGDEIMRGYLFSRLIKYNPQLTHVKLKVRPDGAGD